MKIQFESNIVRQALKQYRFSKAMGIKLCI